MNGFDHPPEGTSSFLKRVLAECQRYGADPWVFLRELGQNSRDAYASRIDIAIQMRAAQAAMVFSDDGRGMTFDHARRYLFRLYASSKDQDREAAGRYGVGFWSVLRFNPARLEVHSRTKREAWGVALSENLGSWKMAPCRRSRQGTTVVLVRPVRPEQEADFHRQVELGVVRYLSRLRTAGRRSRPLPLFLNGRQVNRPFQLDGPGTLAFQDGDVEGVVGIGSRPSYVLYARGLPVAQGAYLEELEGKRVRTRVEEEREGAAPVYLLNGNRLDVILSRQNVLKNRALRRLVETARRRFAELVSRTVDSSVPRSLSRRMLNAVADFNRRISSGPTWIRLVFFLLVLIFLGGFLGVLIASLEGPQALSQVERLVLLRTAGFEPDEALSASPRPTFGEVMAEEKNSTAESRRVRIQLPVLTQRDFGFLRTSTVEAPSPEPAWALRYQPPLPLMFRLVSLDRFDRRGGWQPAEPQEEWRAPDEVSKGSAEVLVTLAHDGRRGSFLLPVPSGYAPVPGSARLGGQAIPLLVNRKGLAQVVLPDCAPASFTFRVASDPGTPVELSDSLPIGLSLPGGLDEKLGALAFIPRTKRIREVAALVGSLVVYDRSPRTAEAFSEWPAGAKGNWAEKVLAIGAGDCDVINGLAVLLLRKAGIPARLVLGIVGRGGRGLPGLHAWVEVEDSGLKVVDASQGRSRPELGRAKDGAYLTDAKGDTIAGHLKPGPLSAVQKTVSREILPSSPKELLVVVGGGVLLLILVFLMVLVCSGIRGRSKLTLAKDASRRRELLCRMATDALGRPGAWREVPGLWYRPFIPCLGGRFISLDAMIRLASRDRLFIGSRGCDLAEQAVRSGALVLDRRDEDFASLYARMPNLRDLDELADLKPLKVIKGLPGILIREVNLLMRKAKSGAVCRAVSGREDRFFWDVDLTPIRLRRGSGWSRRVLAVWLDHPWWQEVAGLYARSPAVALSVAVDRLADESGLLKQRAAGLRRAAARRALE